jgi:hypothetical protein
MRLWGLLCPLAKRREELIRVHMKVKERVMGVRRRRRRRLRPKTLSRRRL